MVLKIKAIDALTMVIFLTKKKGMVDGLISSIKNARSGYGFMTANEHSRQLINPNFNLNDLKVESKRIEAHINNLKSAIAKHNSTRMIDVFMGEDVETMSLFEAFSRVSRMEVTLNEKWQEANSALTVVVPKDVKDFNNWEESTTFFDEYDVILNNVISLKKSIADANNDNIEVDM